MTLFWAVTALAGAAVPASADQVSQWQAFISEASERFDVPERWIWHVIAVESGGRVETKGVATRSRAGAMGLMQLMPSTWAAMRDALHLGSNPDDPHDNIIAGTAYLRAMYDSFGYPGLFAAYNAGPSRYADYLSGKRPLPQETRTYENILTSVTGAEASLPSVPPPTLFTMRNGTVIGDPEGLFAFKRPLP